MTGPIHGMRQLLGVLLKDWVPYRRALAAPGTAYLALRNRTEQLEAAPDASGYRCQWSWTSDLHAPKHLPHLGRQLMERCLADHPILRAAAPAVTGHAPEVTFIIGHKGMERLPHLLATLESIAGQEGAAVDCVVVEQDTPSRIASHLPSWVRHIHTPPPRTDMPYCRSWTFNVGARTGASPVLVLHDNDMLVPRDYAARILERVREGHDVVNLKRFIFYLDEEHTKSVLGSGAGLGSRAPQSIVQNLEAGGSIAITREGFERIGGMDESFIGWGGEDNEFWERAQSLRIWPYASLPIVHLWHAPQPGKQQAGQATAMHYEALSRIAVSERIARLRAAPRGEPGGPSIAHTATDSL